MLLQRRLIKRVLRNSLSIQATIGLFLQDDDQVRRQDRRSSERLIGLDTQQKEAIPQPPSALGTCHIFFGCHIHLCGIPRLLMS